MKVQRVRYPDEAGISWLVLGHDYLPVAPIQRFLRYLESIERSPNTVRAYAHHPRLYWEFLDGARLDWPQVHLGDLADFVAWLRAPRPAVASLRPRDARRRETTVNAILQAVTSFYEFHRRDGGAGDLAIYRETVVPSRRYKNFLYHLSKGSRRRTSLLQLKAPRRLPRPLTPEQVQHLIAACPRYRDRFLLCLLYDTGMRVGQALGLRHEDIVSWDNEIRIVPRSTNVTGARAKARAPYVVPVSPRLMRLYSDYLGHEFGDVDSDHVFVAPWGGRVGEPLTYAAVIDLFRRLSRKTGIRSIPTCCDTPTRPNSSRPAGMPRWSNAGSATAASRPPSTPTPTWPTATRRTPTAGSRRGGRRGSHASRRRRVVGRPSAAAGRPARRLLGRRHLGSVGAPAPAGAARPWHGPAHGALSALRRRLGRHPPGA